MTMGLMSEPRNDTEIRRTMSFDKEARNEEEPSGKRIDEDDTKNVVGSRFYQMVWAHSKPEFAEILRKAPGATVMTAVSF